MKKKEHLPLFGIGPFLIWGMVLIDAVSIILFYYMLSVGKVNGYWALLMCIIGGILTITGAMIWFIGAVLSGMDKRIKGNHLKTDGIYAWVRNPMYSGCWILFSGLSLMWHNICLIPFIFINWVIMTVVLKVTEEKWLYELYGSEYEGYCRRVNRCIPWKRN